MNRSESQTLRRRDWIPLGGYEFRKIVGVGWIDELTNIDYRKGVPDRGRISTATCSMCSQARQADLFAVEVQGEAGDGARHCHVVCVRGHAARVENGPSSRFSRELCTDQPLTARTPAGAARGAVVMPANTRKIVREM